MTDAELLQSENGFAELYQRHIKRVSRYVRAKLFDYYKGLHDEIVQEVFFKLWRLRSTYDHNRPFLPWLNTIAQSVTIDALRRERRHHRMRTDSIEELAGNWDNRPDSTVMTPWQLAALRVAEQYSETRYRPNVEVSHLLAKLTPPEREFIKGAFSADDFKSAAEEAGVNYKTYWARLQRCLQTMQGAA